MRGLHWTALILAIIGAINWGLVGIFDFNLVAALFGAESAISRVIYALVGIAGLVLLGTSASLASGAPHHRATGVPHAAPR